MEFNGIMTPLVAIDSATSKLKPSLEVLIANMWIYNINRLVLQIVSL